MDSSDENVYVSQTTGTTVSGPTLDAATSSTTMTSDLPSSSSSSSSAPSSSSLAGGLHHMMDVVKAHLPGNVIQHTREMEPHPVGTTVGSSSADTGAHGFLETLKKVEPSWTNSALDDATSASSTSAPSTSSSGGFFSSLFSSSSTPSTTSTTVTSSSPSTSSSFTSTGSEIPIASYPPRPDDAPSKDPTLEYSLPSERSKMSERFGERVEDVKKEAGELRKEAGEKAEGLMGKVKEDWGMMKDKLHEAGDHLMHPAHTSTSKTTSTTTTTVSAPSTTATTTSSSDAPAPTATFSSIADSPAKAGSTGTGWGFSKESGRKEKDLSPRTKEEFDNFPTKMDRKGDLDSFKSYVHNEGQRLDNSRNDSRYRKKD